MARAALERIAFQVNSKFPEELTDNIQHFMDYAHEIIDADPKTSMRDFRRHVAKYSDPSGKSLSEALAQTIQKYTNLKVSVNLFVKNTINAGFWPGIDGKLTNDLIGTFQGMRANTFRGPRNRSKKFVDLVKDITDGYNLKTGRLTAPDNVAKRYTPNIDIHTGLFITKYLNPARPDIHLTADEIAAVILHELGHASQWLEHAWQAYVRTSYANETLTLITDNLTTREERINFAKDVKSQVPVSSKKVHQSIDKAIAVDDDGTRAVMIATPVAISMIALLLAATIAIWVTKFVMSLLEASLRRKYADVLSAGANLQKVSETLVTEQQIKVMEREADEYVSRFGAGPSLLRGLAKVHVHSKMGLSHEYAIAHASALCTSELSWIKRLECARLIPEEQMSFFPYDKKDVRLDRMIRDTAAIFKNSDLPKETRDAWLSKVREMEADLKEMDKKYPQSLNYRFWEMFTQIANASPSAFDLLLNAGLIREYAKLQSAQYFLVRNKLSYFAAILDQRKDKG
jgi:hypothetical protein